MMNNVKIFFAGDFCSKPSTAPIKVSDDLKAKIQLCDIKVVNFEVPLRPENVILPPQKRERFFQNDDCPDFLRGLGFNLFQLANNHAFDWGEAGLMKTKAALGDDAFGVGTYEEAYKVKIVEKNGIRIGFMALSFAAYTGVFDNVQNHEGLGCAYLNDLRVNHDIIEAKKSVDYLFVLPHEGIEYIDIPMPETIARYRDFIDYGADGVIGTHPHCPQGWEEYKGKPIFYSLGNFLFNSKEGYDYRAWNRPHWYEGRCVVLEIISGEIRWEVINTRNRDNLAIELDNSEESMNHNQLICEYLYNKKKYRDILKKIGEEIGYGKEMLFIDKTFHQQHLWETTKVLAKCWKKKILKRKSSSDLSLLRLLKHDSRRTLLIWAMILENEK